MKEFIKKFSSAVSAHNYVITDIPFTTSVDEIPVQNLVCNKTGKHLENDNGIVIICPPDPVGPPDNEIWYWGEYYDLANVISTLGQETSYIGPAILSNEQVGDKYVITFDGPVTKLGVVMTGDETGEMYPLFVGDPPMGIQCNITSIEISDSVTSIESFSFFYCSELTNINISNNVVSIGKEAFDNCTSLQSITISDSVTSIGNAAFQNCVSLVTLIIGDSVTSIGDGAFAGCLDLTSINIPNSVISIGQQAFYFCSSLTSVTIGNSVTSIGDGAFSECSGLTSVTCEATTPPTIKSTTWSNVTKSIPVYVPADSVSLYQQAQYWSQFTNIQQIP